MIELAQRDTGKGKKGFANASDYLETWDDSYSIMDVNAHKKISDIHKDLHGHSTTSYQGSKAI